MPATRARPILLVGNGPNRVAPDGLSWASLMQQLRSSAGLPPDGHETKPFPLHFEEILGAWLTRRRTDRAARFLREVAAFMARMQPNAIHARLLGLDASDILTTNFDDCLERSLAPMASLDNFDTNEVQHSLFRRSRIGRRHFWHVHGDIFHPASVLLGHFGYVAACARIRRYCDPSLGIPFKAHAQPLTAVFRAPRARLDARRPHSWVDLFLMRDMHIVGLGLDYTEVDLWYLLSLRHRLQRGTRGLPRNRIVFHDFEGGGIAQAQKHDLLRGFAVDCRLHPVPRGDWMRAWEAVLSLLEREIGRRR